MTSSFRTAAVLGILCLFSSTPADAAQGWYISATGDYVKSPAGFNYEPSSNGFTDFKDGYGFTAALGYKLSNGFRLEGEAGYHLNRIRRFSLFALPLNTPASGAVKHLTGLANVYYDLDTHTPWTPYAGAGIGLAHTDYEMTIPAFGKLMDDTDDVFAYQLSAGVGYAFTENVTAFGGYRYMHFNHAKLVAVSGATPHAENVNHDVQVGVRYSF